MWTKICGVTSCADANQVESAGADAIGLNFHPPSKRFVAAQTKLGANAERDSLISVAREIRDSVGDRIEVVGVFVNSSADDVADIATRTKLDAVQFHGDETPEAIANFHLHCPQTAIIRAFRIGDRGTVAMDDQLRRFSELNVPLAAVLVDAFVDGEYGGTGHTVNADVVNEWSSAPGKNQRLVLAGGLTHENVAAAAQSVQPWGIDTASGVESAPGIKCPKKVRAFVDAVRSVSEGAPTVRLRNSDA